jgi:hypothetical protein
MLLYQAEDYSWIQAAIDQLKQNPNILTITPLPDHPRKICISSSEASPIS